MEATLTSLALQAFVNVTLISLVVGFFTLRREARIKAEIQQKFDKQQLYFERKFEYKEKALAELLGPVYIELRRTKNAAKHFTPFDEFTEEQILKNGNETILDLLITKFYMVPPELRGAAQELVEHYDGWLKQYAKVRGKNYDLDKPFVFTYNFPKEAEKAFYKIFENYWNDLYGLGRVET